MSNVVTSSLPLAGCCHVSPLPASLWFYTQCSHILGFDLAVFKKLLPRLQQPCSEPVDRKCKMCPVCNYTSGVALTDLILMICGIKMATTVTFTLKDGV